MGHTTRVISVARELHLRNAELFLAGNEWQLSILAEAFPAAQMIPLQGYDVRYGKRLPASWHVARQFPRLRQTIRREHEWTGKIVRKYGIDDIISDNRYGIWHPNCRNALISHQLIPPIKYGRRLLQPLLWQLHRQFLTPFDHILIPDQDNHEALAAAMRPDQLPCNVCMIGWLSRLQGVRAATPSWLPDHLFPPDVLMLLSGPEPQRSMLEQQFLTDIRKSKLVCWVVQGIAGGHRLPRTIPGGWLIPYLDAPALAYWLPKAGTVVARSGYSSLMDFATLGLRRIVVVPTPGQPEQQYLARFLHDREKAYAWNPRKVSLETAVERADQTSGFRKKQFSPSLLRKWVGQWLN